MDISWFNFGYITYVTVVDGLRILALGGGVNLAVSLTICI